MERYPRGSQQSGLNVLVHVTFKYLQLIICVSFSSQTGKLCAQNHEIKFSDVTKKAGIDFQYTFGDYTYENILESSGSGVTILDYDQDGDLDLYMLNGTYLEGISDPEGRVFINTPNRLYRNNSNGTFTEVAKEAGIDDMHWSMMAGAIDYDNDGDTDIYLLNYGPNVFYRNNGDGTFTDIAQRLGLQGPAVLNGFTKWSVSVAFFDYNNDHLLDLMMGNFLAFDPSYKSSTNPEMMPHPSEYDGQASLFFQQQADGTFIDVTMDVGLYFPDSKCMGLTAFDYDDDGDLDIFQGNDHQSNFMFRNDGNSVFIEVAVASGIAVNDQGLPTGSMHGSPGDVDGDGLIDILVTDLKHGSLYRNLGNGLFEDITSKSGVANIFSGKDAWAAALFDFDNDGDLDIFSANGVAEQLILQKPILMENDGSGNFKNVGPELSPYFNQERSGRGAAVWDYDNDGDMDIIVSHIDLKRNPVLLRNDGGNANHWLGITLHDNNGPATDIGARVTLYAGDLKLTRVNQRAASYLSSNDPRIHFGLKEQSIIDQIEVRWSDGELEVFSGIEVDRYVTISRGSGQ